MQRARLKNHQSKVRTRDEEATFFDEMEYGWVGANTHVVGTWEISSGTRARSASHAPTGTYSECESITKSATGMYFMFW